MARARMLIDRGAEAVVLASCIFRGTPIGFACPHAAAMKEAIARKLGADITLIDWTH